MGEKSIGDGVLKIFVSAAIVCIWENDAVVGD